MKTILAWILLGVAWNLAIYCGLALNTVLPGWLVWYFLFPIVLAAAFYALVVATGRALHNFRHNSRPRDRSKENPESW